MIPTPILDIGFAVGAQSLPYWHIGDPVRGVVGTAVIGSSALEFTAIPLSRLISFTVDRGVQRIDSPLIRYDAGTATIVLHDPNSDFDPDNLASVYAAGGVTQVTPMVPIRLRVRYGTDVYPLFYGFADSWEPTLIAPMEPGVTIRATDAFKIFRDPSARTALGSPVGAGETTGARINRILDAVGWPAGDRLVDTGDETVQATLFAGSALDEMLLTADSELGELYVQPDGKVRFRARSAIRTATRSVTSQAVFGNWQNVGSGELPYKARELDYGDSRIANQILATNVDGTQQSKSDTASQTRYRVKSFERSDLVLRTDTDSLMWAGLILYQSKDWEQWVTSLSIDPRALEDSLYPQVFSREIGDRITVKRRPQGGSTPTISDSFTRANSTTTLGSTESPVLAWTANTGTWGISTNRAYSVTATDNDHATISVGTADMTVSAKLSSFAANRFPSVVARFVDVSNSYMAEVNGNTGNLVLYRRIGASNTSMTTITFADGDVVGLATIEESGSTRVTLYKNSVQQFTTLDSTSGRPAGTRAGFRWGAIGTPGQAFYDDFSVVYGTGNVIVRDSFIRGVSHSFGPGPNRWATKWALQSASKYTFFTIGNATTGKLKAYGIA